MVIVDSMGVIVLVNARTEELFGYPREQILGQSVEILLPEDARLHHEINRLEFAADPYGRAMGLGPEFVGRRLDGTEFALEISLNPLETEHGTLVLSVLRDVSEHKRRDVEASHFRSVVEFSQDAIIGKDLDGVIISWNSGARRLYGYTAPEVIGKSVSILVPQNHENEIPELLRRIKAGEVIENYDTIRVRKDGTHVNVSLTLSPIRTPDGQVKGASTISRNNTERLHYQEQLIELSERDALTGLRNRRRFELDVADQVQRAHRYGEVAVLMMIDLNGFKQINDVHGHRAGDQVLKCVATALKERLRDTDMVARIGGDEFAVIMPYARLELAVMICDGLQELIGGCSVDVVGASKVRLTASFGQVEINQDTVSEEDVIAEVDRLMYADKVSDSGRKPRT